MITFTSGGSPNPNTGILYSGLFWIVKSPPTNWQTQPNKREEAHQRFCLLNNKKGEHAMQLFKIILTTTQGAPVAQLDTLGDDVDDAIARARANVFARTGRTNLKTEARPVVGRIGASVGMWAA